MYIEEYEAHFIPACAGWGSSLSWDFLTERQTTIDGSEERISLRQLPRESISYNYTYFREESIEINNEIQNHLRDKWICPYWFMKLSITSRQQQGAFTRIIIGGDQVSSINEMYSVEKNYPVLLYRNRDDYIFVDVMEVGGLNNGDFYIDVDDALFGVDLSKYSLYPVTFSKIIENISMNVSYEFETFSVTYASLDLPEIDEYSGSIKYPPDNGIDIFTDCLPIGSNSAEVVRSRDLFISGNPLGITSYSSDWSETTISMPMNYTLKGRRELYSLMRWLMRRMGSFRPFYMPNYLNELEFDYIVENQLILTKGDPNRMLFALFNDDDFSIIEAESVELFNGKYIYRFAENITIEPKKVYYASLFRLGTDSFTFEFEEGMNVIRMNTDIRSVW